MEHTTNYLCTRANVIHACRNVSGDFREVFSLVCDGVDPKLINKFLDKPLLHLACKYGSLKVVQILIEKHNHDPMEPDDYGDTPFHYATEGNHLHVLEYLLTKQHFDPHCKNQLQDTPLHVACHGQGQLPMVQLLLSDSRVIPDTQNEGGETPLHAACHSGDLEVITVLIHHPECTINCQNIFGNTPLHIACYKSHLEAVEAFSQHTGIDANLQNEDGNTPLHVACSKKEPSTILDVVLSIRNCSPNIQNCNGDTPLHIACTKMQVDVVEKILSHPLTKSNLQNHCGKTPLDIACYISDVCTIDRLLMHNCPLHEYNCVSVQVHQLLSVCYAANLELLQSFTEACGVEALQECQDSNGNTLLHIACLRGDLNTATYLISQCQLNLQSPNLDGDTVLHVAARGISTDIVEVIVKQKQCVPNGQNKSGNTPLHVACQMKSSTVVAALLELDSLDLNCMNEYGDTALHLVTREEHLELIELLVSREDCNPNVPNKFQETPLHIACQNQDLNAVIALTRDQNRSCAVNCQNMNGDTPLHIACYNRQKEVISCLTQVSSLVPNLVNQDHVTPLHIACNQQDVFAVNALMDIPWSVDMNNQDQDGNTALHVACLQGNLEVIKILIERAKWNMSIQNKYGNTPLHVACRECTSEIIIMIINGQSDGTSIQNEDGDTALHIACCRGALDVMKLLLDSPKCTPNATNKESETALIIASATNNLEAAMLLIEHRHCNINCQNEDWDTPLHLACLAENHVLAGRLLGHPYCNPNLANRHSKNPLHTACEKQHLTLTEILLKHPYCNPNYQDEQFNTPLHVACEKNNLHLAKILVAHPSCNVNLQDIYRDTPLHIACKHNDLAIATLLLEHQYCDPNCLNMDSDSALHIVCHCGWIDGVEVLLKHPKCDPNYCNRSGHTSLHLACLGSHTEIVQLLCNIPRCDVNLQSWKTHDSPLHIASLKLDIIQVLTQNPMLDINTTNNEGNTPLHLACLFTQPNVVQFLLDKQSCNPNVQNKVGNAPLHLACLNGNIVILRSLFSCQGINPYITNVLGKTPLGVACDNCCTTVVNFLLIEKHCKLFHSTHKAETLKKVVHLACYNAQYDILKLFIEMMPCSQNNGCTNTEPMREILDNILLCSCQEGYLELLHLLVQKHCNLHEWIDEHGNTLLHIALDSNHVGAVRFLVEEHSCDPNQQNNVGYSPLYLAARNNQVEIVKVLLRGKQFEDTTCQRTLRGHEDVLDQPEVVTRGITPLHVACLNQSTEMTQTLVEQSRCSPNCQDDVGYTPLHIACTNGHTEIVISLLSHQQTNPNIQTDRGQTPLDIACLSTHLNPKIIHLLLTDKRHAEIDQNKELIKRILYISGVTGSVDLLKILGIKHYDLLCNGSYGNGDSLMHIVCLYNQHEALKFLLEEYNLEPNHTDDFGNTPLHLACYHCHENVVKVLIKLAPYCDPNIQNQDGDTPLHILCRKSERGILELIINNVICDTSSRNKNGNTPLHVAALEGRIENVKYLAERTDCNPNLPNNRGNTLLHLLSCRGTLSIELLRIFTQRFNCNVNQRNKDGNTPLHIACYNSQTEILQMLLENTEIDPNLQNNEGNTLLHVACMKGQLEVVSVLHRWQPINAQYLHNAEGNAPIHIACSNSLELLKILSENYSMDPNYQKVDGDTPMHIVCKHGRLELAEFLIQQQCDLNIPDKDGNTPLHIASSYHKHIGLVKLFLSSDGCDPNRQNNNGDTPAHIACYQGDVRTITVLSGAAGYNPNVQNNNGDTVMHVVCHQPESHPITDDDYIIVPNIPEKATYGRGEPVIYRANPSYSSVDTLHVHEPQYNAVQTDDAETLNGSVPGHIYLNLHMPPPSVKEVLSESTSDATYEVNLSEICRLKIIEVLSGCEDCDLNLHNRAGYTPLHTAILSGMPSLAHRLIGLEQCNPTLADSYSGNSPLHLACRMGDLSTVDTLLATGTVDPCCRNANGQLPADLTHNYSIIKKHVTSFAESKENHQLDSVKIFVVGNPLAGKTSLVEAICKQESGTLRRLVFKYIRGVNLSTAGIIPSSFCSKHFGNVVFFDLAGQYEYYSSHAAMLENTIMNSASIFFIVVDVNEGQVEILKQLKYWLFFLENCCKSESSNMHIIVVGSHADVVKVRQRGALKDLPDVFLSAFDGFSQTLHYTGHILLDCRKKVSPGLKKLNAILVASCDAIRSTSKSDHRCHVLYAFLLNQFPSYIALRVSDISVRIQQLEDALLPHSTEDLVHLLSIMGDRGEILLLKHHQDIQNSWAILQRDALLSKVIGTIFAPRHFVRHSFGRFSTGVVPVSKIRKEFPSYDPHMIVSFLIHLEFCQKIQNGVTNAITDASHTQTFGEECYFFPALVNIDKPEGIWEYNDKVAYQCGWCLQCNDSNKFLTSRFLHVLLLRLAFSFAMPREQQAAPVIQRHCSIWRNGIQWLNRDCVETTVEVKEQNRCVVMMMRCEKDNEVHLAHLRSQVIKTILASCYEFCPRVSMSEYFIDPAELAYPIRNPETLNHYNITEISEAVISGKPYALCANNTNTAITLKKLLLFEPYCGLKKENLVELFSIERASQQLEEDYGVVLAECVSKNVDKFKEAQRILFRDEGRLC